MDKAKKQEIQRLREALTRQTTEVVNLRRVVRTAGERKGQLAGKIAQLQAEIVRIDEEAAAAPAKIAEVEKRIAACQRKLRVSYLGPKLEQLQQLAAKMRELEMDLEESL